MMVAGLQLTVAEQVEMVLKTAGVDCVVVPVPPLYLTVHVTSIADSEMVYRVLCLRDDLRWYGVRKFSDDCFVLLYTVGVRQS